jgi:6-phosphofructokinase 1
VLASTAGVAAADAAVAGKWGRMTALCGNEIDIVPLSDAVAQLKRVPTATYQVAETFFG